MGQLLARPRRCQQEARTLCREPVHALFPANAVGATFWVLRLEIQRLGAGLDELVDQLGQFGVSTNGPPERVAAALAWGAAIRSATAPPLSVDLLSESERDEVEVVGDVFGVGVDRDPREAFRKA